MDERGRYALAVDGVPWAGVAVGDNLPRLGRGLCGASAEAQAARELKTVPEGPLAEWRLLCGN